MSAVQSIITCVSLALIVAADFTSVVESDLVDCNKKYNGNVEFSSPRVGRILTDAVRSNTNDQPTMCVYDCILKRMGILTKNGFSLPDFLHAVSGENVASYARCIDAPKAMQCLGEASEVPRADEADSSCLRTRKLLSCVGPLLTCPL
ncbi:uncharacterized protein LOC134529591 [Bacillus rossius redtenbacheri]|uniref:uncharacterized protein LOC134529591 n=1 Tax=Bacillus rossius redtenbacheri TaxID=93214 RepID=UPI002FDE785C